MSMKNNSMYLHPELETMTRPEIEKLQMERLKTTLQRCMNAPFYKKRFEEHGLKPEDIRSLEDLRKIPFTTKQDLRDNYPFGMSVVPLNRWYACIPPVERQELLPLSCIPKRIWMNGPMR